MNKVKFKSWNCIVEKSTYRHDGSISLSLVDAEDGQPVATASTYLEDFPIADDYKSDHCWIKTWSENNGIVQALQLAGVIDVTGTTQVVNPFGDYAILAKVLI